MFKLTLLIALFSLVLSPGEPSEEKAELVIVVQGDSDLQGTVWFSICASESEFGNERGGVVMSAFMQDGKAIVDIEGMAPGFYAVKLFVDKNSNDRLDQGLWGIPKEPYGFSNNAMGVLGPPSFKEAGFHVLPRKENRHMIRLRGC